VVELAHPDVEHTIEERKTSEVRLLVAVNQWLEVYERYKKNLSVLRIRWAPTDQNSLSDYVRAK
jgi:hypothetical protein